MRARRYVIVLLTSGLFMLDLSGAALAQREPVIVVPGRAGVPVMMYGRDVSGAVIEGEFGLDRPGHVGLTIIPYGPVVIWGPPPGGYFPATGRTPRYGRYEVEPPRNRPMPPPAEDYFRSWSSQSDPTPATMPSPYDSLPIIIGPPINYGRKHRPAPPPAPGPAPVPVPGQP